MNQDIIFNAIKRINFFIGLLSIVFGSPSFSSSNSICLMEDPQECVSPPWVTQYISYTESIGKQKQRLEDEEDYIFVKNTKNLSVGYGILTEKSDDFSQLELSKSVYEKLSRLGTELKILNGYINNFNESEEVDFTPTSSNVLISHISFIIQWAPNEMPALVPAGTLKEPIDKTSIIFMSGGSNGGNDKDVEDFYNLIYKKPSDPSIIVYSGKKVADNYVPYILREKIEKRLYPFDDTYLSTIYSKVLSFFPHETNSEINCTLKFLNYLFKNEYESLFKGRQDTVAHLENFVNNFPPIKKLKNPLNKEIYEESSFLKELEINKNIFFKGALKRLESLLSKIPDKNRKLLQDYIHYVDTVIFLKEKITDFEKVLEFWKFIKSMDSNFTCTNPDSTSQFYTSLISIEQRMIKYALEGYTGSHTEPLFIKKIRANPFLLTQELPRIKEENKKLIPSNFEPKFLGIIIDAYSWLDSCKNCSQTLSSSNVWADSLSFLQEDIRKQGFTIPFNSIDSLFRIFSHCPYDKRTEKISNSGGGPDYKKEGWDFRVLTKPRYTLATRLPKTLLTRDNVFEKISNSITRQALIKEENFWLTENISHKILSSKRKFSSNALRILLLRFPTSIPLRRVSIKIEYENSNFDKVYEIYNSLLDNLTTNNLPEEHRQFCDLFYSPETEPERLMKIYFGWSCYKKTKELIREMKKDGLTFGDVENNEDMKKYINSFITYGLAYGELESCNRIQEGIEAAETYAVKKYKQNSATPKIFLHGLKALDRNNMKKFISLVKEFMASP